MSKHIGAHDRFPGRQFPLGCTGNIFGKLSEHRGFEIEINPFQVFQCHNHLFHGGITGTFTQSDNSNPYPFGTGVNTCQSIGSSHTEIIMGVHLYINTNPGDKLTDPIISSERIQNPHSITVAQTVGSCLLGGLSKLIKKFRIRTGCILSINGNIHTVLFGKFRCLHHVLQHLLSGAAQLVLNMNIRG